MKRNKRALRKSRAPAPYTKQGKRPYQYSAAYHTWRAAVLKGVNAEEAAIAHKRAMNKEAKIAARAL